MRLANAYGTDLLFDQYEGYTGAENGLDLVTTIDLTIQHYVEKSLYQAVEDYDIQNGAGAIAMDVKTGKILAMASIGGYDLNNFLDVSDEAKKRSKKRRRRRKRIRSLPMHSACNGGIRPCRIHTSPARRSK